MRRGITSIAVGLVLAVSVIGVVFVVGMRTKSPAVVNGVRKLGRAMRPMAIKSAGQPGTSTSIVHHVGRTSGRSYSTPVEAVPTEDGFVIALPYGLSADWMKNVLARGSASITHDGSTHEVDRPEIVPLASVEQVFSAANQRAHRVFGVDQGLRVRRATAEVDTEAPE